MGASIAASAAGKIQWQASNNIAVGRRLAEPQLAASTSNTTDPDCIVGGYDAENPTKIYIGGPCKDLEVTVEDGMITKVKPAPTFRWIEMETVHMEITDGKPNSEPAPFQPTSKEFGAGWDTGFYIAKDHTSYVEVQCGSSFHLNVPNEERMGAAGLFASTTSYLIRDTFSFNKNEFCVDAVRVPTDPSRIEFKENGAVCKMKMPQCVAPCCADPGVTECSCDNKCPDEKLQATPGLYKYSIMAASFNNGNNPKKPSETFKKGAEGNGWERLVAEFGKSAAIGEPAQLTGFMDVYQMLDFTNMNIDVLEVIAPDGTSALWKDMSDCDMTAANYAKNGYDCTAKEVRIKSLKVSSDGDWSAHYAFPTTQNVGVWTVDEKTEALTMTPSATRTVQISAVKPSGDTLAEWKYAKDILEASRKKVLLVRYRFDIKGITAEGHTSGRYMNYDPTVTGPTGVNAPTTTTAPTGGTAGGAGSAATGEGAAAGGSTEASGAMTYSLAALALTLAAKMC